jgi:hypothetical protein
MAGCSHNSNYCCGHHEHDAHIANTISFDLPPMENMSMAQTISDIDSLNILLLQ